jgi:hypothetical protein
VFTPFHKPPYTYPYGRSIDKTMTFGAHHGTKHIRSTDPGGSAFAGIGDTIAIGRVLYDSSFPIIAADNLWVPARENLARFTVVPIRDIHIFIRETDPTPPRKPISGGLLWLKPQNRLLSS